MVRSYFNDGFGRGYLVLLLTLAGWACGAASSAAPCIVPDSGGTAGLPPVGCVYTTPDGVSVSFVGGC